MMYKPQQSLFSNYEVFISVYTGNIKVDRVCQRYVATGIHKIRTVEYLILRRGL